MDAASSGPSAGPSETVAQVAADVLVALRVSAVDVGDDRTQVDLDDVLEALERRLAVLAGEDA